MRQNLAKYWPWIILTLIFWIIAFKCIPKEFYDLGGDSAQYIILAESLSQGRGFRMINHPVQPFCFYYPPVFPLLLSPIVYFFGRNFSLMHLFIILLGYLSLYFFHGLFKRYTDTKIAYFIIGFLALNWAFILYSTNYILSDIPYLFFAGFTFFWATLYLEKPSFVNKQGFLVIFGLVLSYFTRYIAATLFLGIMASLLLNTKEDKVKFKKIIFLGSSFLIVFAIWHFFKSLNPAPVVSHLKQLFLIDPYVPHKGSLFASPLYFVLRFIEGTDYYYKLLGDVFFFWLLRKWAFLKEFLSGFIMAIMLLGLWFKFKEDKSCVFHYYFLFYLLLVIFWPFREGVRFLLPILPFIFFYFLCGLKRILYFLPRKISSFGFPILFSGFFIFNALSLPVVFKYPPKTRPSTLKNFVSLHKWIELNLPKEGIILSRKPTVTYFYANHQSICYPFSLNPEEIWQEVLRNNVKYIIVDEFSRETHYYLLPFIYKYKDKLKLLYRIENTSIFEVRKE